MTTDESVLNLHKAVDEVFPVRRVLGMLQRNERLSAPPPNEHQENQDFNTQREMVSESPPSQLDEASQETDATQGELFGSLDCPKCGQTYPSETTLRVHLTNTPCGQPLLSREDGKLEPKMCFKCGKTFASWQGLRGHLNRVKPCDEKKSATISSTTTTRRRPAATRTCGKCGKTFSSPQSLRIHMNRVKPCDQDKNGVSAPTTPPATPPTKTLLMDTEEAKKEAERKVKARYQARKAYLKKRGRLGELGNPPPGLCQSDKGPDETASKPGLKRSATDELSLEGENLDASNVEAKRQRVQEQTSQEDLSIDSPSDVSGLTQPSIPTPPSSVPPQKKVPTEGSFVRRSSKRHGGDLLTGGCSCPACVRRWARKLMNRMQQLEDEVLTLRKQNKSGVENGTANDAGTCSTDSPAQALQVNTVEMTRSKPMGVGCSLPYTPNGGPHLKKTVGMTVLQPTGVFRELFDFSSDPPQRGGPGSVSLSNSSVLPRPGGQSIQNESRLGDLLRAGENQQHTLTASVRKSSGSDKRSLLDAYSHMNDQILLNERTVEDSSGHAQILAGGDPATVMDFRKQIDELRVSITAEKSKRESAVAALIAHEWKPRRNEFMLLLERASETFFPSEEQAQHAKWSELSDQLSAKEKIISELERRMDSLGENDGRPRTRYAEMGELSSKMAAEYSVKMALESDREGIYLGLVKSNTRIRSLVRSALL